VRRISIRGPVWARQEGGLHRSEDFGSGTGGSVGDGRTHPSHHSRRVSTRVRRSATPVLFETWPHTVPGPVPVHGALRFADSADTETADTAGATQQDNLLRRPQRLLILSDCPALLWPLGEETGQRSGRKQCEKYHQARTCLILLLISPK
jgi:hypothetical protein